MVKRLADLREVDIDLVRARVEQLGIVGLEQSVV
jgi:hypothetical protein